MKRIFILTAALLLGGFLASAQTDTLVTNFSDEYLDTVRVRKRPNINNYTMIGASYGITQLSASLNPKVSSQARPYAPGYWSIMFTHYEKMFDYLPFFGFQIGFAHAYEGYEFKPNGKSGNVYFYPNDLCSAVKVETYEIPMLAQIHSDSEHFKIMASGGIYLGYRTAIERTMSPTVTQTIWSSYIPKFEEYQYKFYPYDNRWDYGLQAGLGVGLVFSPIEIHAGAMMRYGWSSYFQPDTNYPSDSQYADRNQVFYRFATPMDITFVVGIHYQITRRRGKTHADLRKEAYEIVYGKEVEQQQSDTDEQQAEVAGGVSVEHKEGKIKKTYEVKTE